MRRRYLLLFALAGLMWGACSSERSDQTADTVVLDSPAVSDSLDISTADADSMMKDSVDIDTTIM